MNDPQILIDNIAVNGAIYELDDVANQYDEINEDYDGNVEEWANDNGYSIIQNYVVVNWGF